LSGYSVYFIFTEKQKVLQSWAGFLVHSASLFHWMN